MAQLVLYKGHGDLLAVCQQDVKIKHKPRVMSLDAVVPFGHRELHSTCVQTAMLTTCLLQSRSDYSADIRRGPHRECMRYGVTLSKCFIEPQNWLGWTSTIKCNDEAMKATYQRWASRVLNDNMSKTDGIRFSPTVYKGEGSGIANYRANTR